MAKGGIIAYATHRLSALTAVPFASRLRCRLVHRFRTCTVADRKTGWHRPEVSPTATPYFELSWQNKRHNENLFPENSRYEGIPDPLTIGGSCKGTRTITTRSRRIDSPRAGPAHPGTYYFVFIYRFNFSPTTTTTTANDYYTNAPCPRGHRID